MPQTAKMHLEKAIEVAHREGCAVTEIEIAEHHYKLVCPVGHGSGQAPRLLTSECGMPDDRMTARGEEGAVPLLVM